PAMSERSTHHVVPIKVYVGILLALLVLTAITVAVAFQHLGDPWNDVVALTIAVSKATLVVLFFMHVKYSTRMTRITVASAVLWLLFLLLITVADPMSRGLIDVPGK
ncbi:MAG TPA: cytochrome C oxidase subunit IV family protein, partial [Thermoanaerobaculia bacterium]|nr:cytochrome C oxidase subunit IV family protein [Thermoanaerobaculia bacterium]